MDLFKYFRKNKEDGVEDKPKEKIYKSSTPTFTLSSGITVTSPFKYHHNRYTLSKLDYDEKNSISQSLWDSYLDNEVLISGMIADRRDILEVGIMAIKNALGDPYIKDHPLGGDLGVQLIMPHHFSRMLWNEDIWEADTPQDWIDLTPPIEVSKAGFIILGILNYHSVENAPKLLEIRTEADRYILPPIDFRRRDPCGNPDYSIHNLPGLIILPGKRLRFKIICDKGGDAMLIPIGVCVGMGQFLNKF